MRSQVILLGFQWSNAGNHDICRGIYGFAYPDKHWEFSLIPATIYESREFLNWDFDGFISDIDDAELIQRLLEDGKKTVLINNYNAKIKNVPKVNFHHQQLGELAAEHFLEHGYEHFVYLARERNYSYSDLRGLGFLHTLEEHGYEAVIGKPTSGDVSLPIRERYHWLKELPRPCALFACDDQHAFAAIKACRSLNLHVPGDIAIMGSNNDEVICLAGNPTISSISLPMQLAGQKAAAIMARSLMGKTVPEKPVELPPESVIVRHSSDTYPIDDEHVSRALKYIHEHFEEPIKVDVIAEQSGLSRRALEYHFQTAIGMGPHQKLAKIRIEKAKELLRSSTFTIDHIAEKTGFKNGLYLSKRFAAITGEPPSEYRKQFRVE